MFSVVGHPAAVNPDWPSTALRACISGPSSIFDRPCSTLRRRHAFDCRMPPRLLPATARLVDLPAGTFRVIYRSLPSRASRTRRGHPVRHQPPGSQAAAPREVAPRDEGRVIGWTTSVLRCRQMKPDVRERVLTIVLRLLPTRRRRRRDDHRDERPPPDDRRRRCAIVGDKIFNAYWPRPPLQPRRRKNPQGMKFVRRPSSARRGAQPEGRRGRPGDLRRRQPRAHERRAQELSWASAGFYEPAGAPQPQGDAAVPSPSWTRRRPCSTPSSRDGEGDPSTSTSSHIRDDGQQPDVRPVAGLPLQRTGRLGPWTRAALRSLVAIPSTARRRSPPRIFNRPLALQIWWRLRGRDRRPARRRRSSAAFEQYCVPVKARPILVSASPPPRRTTSTPSSTPARAGDGAGLPLQHVPGAPLIGRRAAR